MNTTVQSVPNAKTTDILRKFRDLEEDKFSSIVICVGTNDCSSDDFEAEAVTNKYRDILTEAKLKVGDARRVKLSSVPPRCDSTETQKCIETLNATLVTVAEDEGVSFINNDETFKLCDGSTNDGYLLADGIHLTSKGTNRLAKNMKLMVHPTHVGNVCRPRSRGVTQHHENKPMTQEQPNEWQQVSRQKGQNKSHMRWKRQTQHSTGQEERYCWFCGEKNHVSQNCRHGQKITCHNCNMLGHKSKMCHN